MRELEVIEELRMGFGIGIGRCIVYNIICVRCNVELSWEKCPMLVCTV